MDKIAALLVAAVLLGGCASKPVNPDILQSVHYIGDDWYVAALNTENKVFVHTKEIDKHQATHTHIYASGRSLTTYAFMRNWKIRLVNSSDQPVCAKLKFLVVDYQINIPDGWYIMEPFSTHHVGQLNQMPLHTTERIFSYDSAVWQVDTLNIVSYDETDGCKIPKKVE